MNPKLLLECCRQMNHSKYKTPEVLVCIPLKRDEPKIGIVGKPGSGMGLLLHRITELSKRRFGKKIIIFK